MEKLEREFKKIYGLSFSKIFNVPPNLKPLYPDDEKENLFYFSKVNKDLPSPFFSQGEIDIFLNEVPKDYFQIGFWGHGVNSYAFYYGRVDEWSKIFLRLPYGGWYMDDERMALKGTRFLISFLEFENQVKTLTNEFVAVDSMGYGYYSLMNDENELLEVQRSIFDDGNFIKHFGAYFEDI